MLAFIKEFVYTIGVDIFFNLIIVDDDLREMPMCIGAEGVSTETPVKRNSQAKGPESDTSLESVSTEGAIQFL